MDAVSPLMSAMSSYYSAQSDYEVTVTEKKYEKLIEAAGNNTAKTKKLEEKKEKEVAKIKTKYARKQAAMQVAQAIAQTAISAIAAYSSAMQGADISSNEEDADEKIRLMFCGDWVRDLENGKVVQGGTFGDDNTYTRYPICLTDSRMYPKLTGIGEDVSLSLERMPYNNVKVEIDTHNLYCVKFVTDDIPDPSKIYIFHNRRFVCQKIEMDVSNDGIGKLKTGYFYEML